MADPRFHTNHGPHHLRDIAAACAVTLPNGVDENMQITDVAPLDQADQTQLSFFDNVKYKDQFIATKGGAVICSQDTAHLAPEGTLCLISKSPYKSYALAAQLFYPTDVREGFISPHAIIAKSAKIGENVMIEAGVVIGENVEIGAYSHIGANATISHALIGDHVKIYPGVRIGQDGFGFAIDPAGHIKVPQLGRVMIGDHVEIGANTCIDRGAGPDTVIGDGTWIDNLVQIGHNVKIGRGCIIIAQSGIAGSSTLEDFAVIAAQGGVAGHLTIGTGAQVGAQSGVMRNVGAGEKVFGSPAQPVTDAMRQVAFLKKAVKKK